MFCYLTFIVLLVSVSAKDFYYVKPREGGAPIHRFSRHYEYTYESPGQPGERPKINFRYGVLPDEFVPTIKENFHMARRWQPQSYRVGEVRRAPVVNMPQFPFPFPRIPSSNYAIVPSKDHHTSSRQPLQRPQRAPSNNYFGRHHQQPRNANYDSHFDSPDNEYSSWQYPESSYKDTTIRDSEQASRRAQQEYEAVKRITDDLFRRAQQQMAEFNAFQTPTLFDDTSFPANPWFERSPHRLDRWDVNDNRTTHPDESFRFKNDQIHPTGRRAPPRYTTDEDDHFFGNLPKFDSRFPYDRQYRMIEDITPTHTFTFPKLRSLFL